MYLQFCHNSYSCQSLLQYRKLMRTKIVCRQLHRCFIVCVRVHAILDEWLIRQRNAQCFGWMSSSGPSMQITMQITTSRGLTSGNLKSSWYTETSTRQITKELNHRCENNRMGVLWKSCVVKHVMQTLNVKFHQRETSSWGEIEIWILVCPSSGVYAKGFIISETMLW